MFLLSSPSGFIYLLGLFLNIICHSPEGILKHLRILGAITITSSTFCLELRTNSLNTWFIFNSLSSQTTQPKLGLPSCGLPHQGLSCYFPCITVKIASIWPGSHFVNPETLLSLWSKKESSVTKASPLLFFH